MNYKYLLKQRKEISYFHSFDILLIFMQMTDAWVVKQIIVHQSLFWETQLNLQKQTL